MAGDDRHGASRGPRRLIDAGAPALVASTGAEVAIERVERGEPFRDTVSASFAVGRSLATVVAAAVRAGRFPFVLAGSCDSSKGVLSGFDHAATGVVWIDAHGDFNTPDSTISDYFPGMSLAVVTGHCYGRYWQQMSNGVAVPESATLMLGTRDLDPAERTMLDHSAIRRVAWLDGQPESSIDIAVHDLAQRVDEVYLHIDIDALDPKVAPGVVDRPVPGGLSMKQLRHIIQVVGATFRLRAATLAVFNPARDEEDRTLRVGLRIIDLVTRTALRSEAERMAEAANG